MQPLYLSMKSYTNVPATPCHPVLAVAVAEAIAATPPELAP